MATGAPGSRVGLVVSGSHGPLTQPRGPLRATLRSRRPCASRSLTSEHFENGAVATESAASLLKEPTRVFRSTLGGNWRENEARPRNVNLILRQDQLFVNYIPAGKVEKGAWKS
eukprot:bmy_18485T0